MVLKRQQNNQGYGQFTLLLIGTGHYAITTSKCGLWAFLSQELALACLFDKHDSLSHTSASNEPALPFSLAIDTILISLACVQGTHLLGLSVMG